MSACELEKLDTRGRPLTPEEESLAELMTLLVREFEESKYPIGHAEPLDALCLLMEDRGHRQRDLIPVFGSSSVVSDVLKWKAIHQQGACTQAGGVLSRASLPVHLRLPTAFHQPALPNPCDTLGFRITMPSQGIVYFAGRRGLIVGRSSLHPELSC